ncbi:MAG: hypothetical protein NTW86_12080, partial [Candidatus Sumerlaeota bacterium]|nr:hypothetical protein [Candidatus Sumerlaeota bacterium]
MVYPLAGQIYTGMVNEDDQDTLGRSLPRGSVLLRREFPAREFGNQLIFEIHQPQFSGLLLRHPGMSHSNTLDPNPESYFVPASTPGPPSLLSVSEVPPGSVLLRWACPSAAPMLYLGFAWDIYMGNWVETGPDGTLWHSFW